MFLVKKVAAPLAAVVALFAGFVFVASQGWLSIFGVGSESSDSQVIQAVQRTEEVSLVALSVQGIRKEKRDRSFIPGSGETLLLQYEFTAKLGVDGAKVKVVKGGAHAYKVSVPSFEMIGVDEPTFDVVLDDGGLLSGLTPDIEQAEIINDILSDDEKHEYIEKNTDVLKAQTKSFYDRIITGVDPDAVVTYTFAV